MMKRHKIVAAILICSIVLSGVVNAEVKYNGFHNLLKKTGMIDEKTKEVDRDDITKGITRDRMFFQPGGEEAIKEMMEPGAYGNYYSGYIENEYINTGDGSIDYDVEIPTNMVNNVPLYHQNKDSRWSSFPYNTRTKALGSGNTIAAAACGPTSAAMLITGLLRGTPEIMAAEKKIREEVKAHNTRSSPSLQIKLYKPNGIDGEITPDEAVAMAIFTNSRVPGAGSSHAIYNNIVNRYFSSSLRVRSIGSSQVLSELSKGSIMGVITHTGIFTTGGHFITFVGIEKINGKNYVIVNDPALQSYSGVRKGEFIAPNRFLLSAVLDQSRGNCDGFWVIEKR